MTLRHTQTVYTLKKHHIFKWFVYPMTQISDQSDLPEPSVNVLGEELGPVAPVEVAETSGSPDELHVGGLHDSLEVLVLVLCLEADEVHAAFAAVVSGVEPVPLGAGQRRVVTLPREPVVVVAVTLNSCENGEKKTELSWVFISLNLSPIIIIVIQKFSLTTLHYFSF